MTNMQTSLPLLIVRPSILNPVKHFSTQPETGEMKCPRLLRISISSPFLFPSSNFQCNQCTNTIMNDMIHSILSHNLFGPSILTLLALHRLLSPSVPSLAQASPPCGPSLQSLDLPFTIATGPSSQALSWSSPPWSHDSMSCLICNELLLIITCGLITYVSPYAT